MTPMIASPARRTIAAAILFPRVELRTRTICESPDSTRLGYHHLRWGWQSGVQDCRGGHYEVPGRRPKSHWAAAGNRRIHIGWQFTENRLRVAANQSKAIR